MKGMALSMPSVALVAVIEVHCGTKTKIGQMWFVWSAHEVLKKCTV
jgi:hypothetical protein